VQELTPEIIALLNNLPGFPEQGDFELGSFLQENGVRPSVADLAALPAVGNEIRDIRFVQAENQWYYWDGGAWQPVGGGGGGGVVSVSATAPIASSGGVNPVISIQDSGVSAASYGSATDVPQITITAKGVVSTAADVPIQIAESQVTNLTTDLAARVVGPASATNNAVALFDGTSGKLLKDGSQLTITASAATATVPVIVPDEAVNINADGVAVATPSLRLTGEASGIVRANLQNSSAPAYGSTLGLVEDGVFIGAFVQGVPLPAPATQTSGGLRLTTGDDFSFLQVGKPLRYEYYYTGGTLDTWSEGGSLGSSSIQAASFSTGTTADPAIGQNYIASPYGGISSQIPAMQLYRARGTFASPAAVQSGDALGAIYFSGRNDSGALSQLNAGALAVGAKIQSFAEENFGGAGAGAGLGFWTQANGAYAGDNLVTEAPEMWINNAGNVGIGTGAGATAPWQPTQAHTKLQVAGPIATAVTPVSTNTYSVLATDSVIVADASSTNVIISLPSPVGITGRKYTVKRIDGGVNTVVISGGGGNIDGVSSQALTNQWEFLHVVSDGSQWLIV
jgi:hypothetical protein